MRKSLPRAGNESWSLQEVRIGKGQCGLNRLRDGVEIRPEMSAEDQKCQQNPNRIEGIVRRTEF